MMLEIEPHLGVWDESGGGGEIAKEPQTLVLELGQISVLILIPPLPV